MRRTLGLTSAKAVSEATSQASRVRVGFMEGVKDDTLLPELLPASAAFFVIRFFQRLGVVVSLRTQG
jgi:hypothetical protein